MTILERLRAATGPDRELDGAIAFDTQFRPIGSIGESFALHEAKHDYATSWIAHAIWRDQFDVPDYTASIDAALALVERMLPGWQVYLEILREGNGGCMARVAPNQDVSRVSGATPAFAILIALFAALEAKEKK